MALAAHAEQADDPTALSDAELVDRVRLGDTGAYCELWDRHHGAGLRAAAKITRRYDPDDMVQEAFARILSAIRRGCGPREGFRPYLYATIRNLSVNWTRDLAASDTLDDLIDVVDPESVFDDAVLDRTITGRAFRSLRTEWRTILWYTSVEGMPPREAGRYLGLSANAAAALAYRAREALRVAWIQAHVSTAGIDEGCQTSVAQLGAYKRGQLCTAEVDRLEDHLKVCLRCSILVEELDDVADRLRAVLVPLILGPGLAGAFEGMAGAGFSASVPAPAARPAPSGAGEGAGGVSRGPGRLRPTHAGPGAKVAALVLATALGLTAGWAVWRSLGGEQPQKDPAAMALPERAPAAEDDGDASDDPPTVPGGDPGPAGAVLVPEGLSDLADPDTRPGTATPSASAGPGDQDRSTDRAGAILPSAEDMALPARDADGTPKDPGTAAPQPSPEPLQAPHVDGVTQSLYLPEVRGTADPGASVTVVADGVPVARTTADAHGGWSATLAFDVAPAAPPVVAAYQEVDGRRSPSAPIAEPLDIKTPTVEAVSVVPSPTVTFTAVPGTVVHVSVDGLVTGYPHAVLGGTTVRALIGLRPGPHTVAVRYADPATGRYGAWARTGFTIP
ncbi:sigma-70 family RNA polymerase sigma factor [Xylanimonas allomyrinae]|nr:sigma-70 family RNA polymerase sigma factor [Xylanimonas allomyrinae]